MSSLPAVGVSALVFDRYGRVLLVRRGRPPAQGKWHPPGGRVEAGESLTLAVYRELWEETGIGGVRLGPIVAVVERQFQGFHYLIVDFLGFLDLPEPPVPQAGDDALEARWVSPDEWPEYELGEGLLPILTQARRLRQRGQGGLVDVDGLGSDFVADIWEDKVMRAIVTERSGGPEVLRLEEAQVPKLRPNQVRVQLKAAGINPIDYKMRRDLARFPVTLPAILGCDGAGIVVEVGSEVGRFQVGDEVYFCQPGFNGRQGTYAEYAAVDEPLVAKKPKALDFVQAAAAPLVLLTAWESLYDRVRLESGMKVLIQAGAGGVGHIAIQLAKLSGALVATTVSTPEKEAFVRRLGADLTIRYRDQDVAAEISTWTSGTGVDVALDTVGGEVFSQCCACTKVYGEVVTILEPPADIDWTQARVRNLKIALEMMLTPVLLELPKWQRHQGEILEQAGQWFDQGKLKVQVAKIYPLAEAAEAQRHLETQAPLGKVVLTLD